MSDSRPKRTFRRDSDSRSEALREIDDELDAHLDFVAEELIAGHVGRPAADEKSTPGAARKDAV